MDFDSFLGYEEEEEKNMIDAGLCERVADSNTHAQAMKCLTTFAESVGPGFVFESMSQIMNEHKNPEVLSGALLWMASAVKDYGVTHLKLKDVTDFCIDTGLQSSDAATRNATIKLLGALHEFVGPEIKAFTFFCAMEAEEIYSFEGATTAAPKQLEKLSLDDPQDEKKKNLDDEGTKSDQFQSDASFFESLVDEPYGQGLETVRKWQAIDDSKRCTRCGVLKCFCEPVLEYPFKSLLNIFPSSNRQPNYIVQHVDTVYGKDVGKGTLRRRYCPYEAFNKSVPYASPSIVSKE